MFKTEFKRAFSTISFKIAILIGLIFSILNAIKYNSFSIGEQLKSVAKMDPVTPFQNFMLFQLNPISNVFILIIPLLCTLAYGDSYAEDVNSRFLNSLITRVSKGKYLTTRYIVNFIMAGVTIAVPLLINFIIAMLSTPNIEPDIIYGNSPMLSDSFLIGLYFAHPIIYSLMLIVIDFFWAGAFASIALGVSIFVKNKFLVLIIPFILNFFIPSILQAFNLYGYQPMELTYVVCLGNPIGISFEFIFVVIATFSLFYFGGKKHEVS